MPDVLLKVGSIVLLLGGLIFVHELGHFLVAKLMGVKVVRFSIGFGPRLFGFHRGETEYQIALLPLGGYVKMAGDDPSETPQPEDRGRGFLEQPPWRRFLIALAGPTANLVFPAVIYVALALAQNGDLTAGPVVGTVAPGAPADQAGLRPGDRIAAVTLPDGRTEPVRYFSDLRDLVSPHPGQPLTFRVERATGPVSLTIEPAPEVDSNPIETTRRGVIGVTPSYVPAVVAPVRPGAAGPLEAFDLVISAGGKPVRHAGELERALATAACGPIDLEVVRETSIELPAANLARHAMVRLPAVPTCQGGQRAIALADPTVATFVAAVVPGTPADKAGLRRGDAIAAVNGKKVRSFRDVNALSREFLQPGTPVALALADGRDVSLVPVRETFRDDVTGEPADRLVLGFQAYRRDPVDGRALLAAEVPLARGAGEIATLAWKQLHEVVRLTVLGIARIVTGDISFKTVGGPIMLFSIASEAAEEGWGSFLFKMALISVNLGLMNLLPIPVLDGGHIAQAALEGVTRRPLSVRAREIANLVGIVLLFTLMLFVFKNDIVRLMRPME
jgi:regulator of sigma E protease